LLDLSKPFCKILINIIKEFKEYALVPKIDNLKASYIGQSTVTGTGYKILLSIALYDPKINLSIVIVMPIRNCTTSKIFLDTKSSRKNYN